MLNLGPLELAIIAVIAGVGIIIVAMVIMSAVRRASAGRGGGMSPRQAYSRPLPPLPVDLQERARALCLEGKTVHAVKLIRDETGLGLKEAKDLADALRAGPVDLASRARELKAAGRTEQAIFLVRGETGMDQRDAEAFVATL
jgi:hypothetical protein